MVDEGGCEIQQGQLHNRSSEGRSGRAIRRAKAAHPLIEQQQWIELSRLLERDHYFLRHANGEIGFKFTVVKRWWVWHRSLATGQTRAGV